jgi:HAE1 family hydrophobic/amphiphilic exporter-1
MTEADFGIAADVLLDGRKVGDFRPEGEKAIDLVVRASEEDIDTPEKLYGALVATPVGKVVPVSSLAGIERTAGITEIRHLERKRTITLEVTPPESIALESAMDTIRDKVIGSMKQAGMLAGVSYRLSGAADKLTVARRTLQWDFLLALVITYLLLSALFENFLYPFIIMFTVPLAAAGGFIGLALVNLLIAPQPLDILTMLGFVILIGVVVNNAILIVHQSLNYIRYEGMEQKEAVLESARTRIRPIYMTAVTSIFGMLPLVVAPGPGSELYRGLGSVVLGGLALSTVFTLYVIPSLLLFFIHREKVEGRS